MKIYDTWINAVAAVTGTWFTFLFGTWDLALIVLTVFIGLDYLTGLAKGYVNKTLSSDVGLKGLARKATIFVVLIVAVLLDRLLNTGAWVFRTMVCFFYIANEGISLLENCTGLGLKIPSKLKEALIQLGEGEKKEIINKKEEK